MIDEELDWKESVLSRSIWAVRDLNRLDGSAFRIEFTVIGEQVLTLSLTSTSPIQGQIVPTATPDADPDWASSLYTACTGGPPDNEEVCLLFHKLWTAAGGPHYDKYEWRRLRDALTRGGYKV